jgi:hypothetical protein
MFEVLDVFFYLFWFRKPWIRNGIRIRIDGKYWIRIRIDSNGDPQHCFKRSPKLS